MKTIVCPNCGANATNHENCEFCGSLLVRFEDQSIKFNEEKYKDPDIVNSNLGDILSLHLITAKQAGIGGVCTHIGRYAPRNLAIKEDTVCYIMNGAFLTQFKLALLSPTPRAEAFSFWASQKNDPYHILGFCLDAKDSWQKDDPSMDAIKQYDLSSTKYYGSTFIMVKPFINFSDNSSINSSRWTPSMNMIRKSQMDKLKFLRLDFAQLLSMEVHKFDDYNIELYVIDFGEDIQGAASIVSQIANCNLRLVESYMETVPVDPPTKVASIFRKLF